LKGNKFHVAKLFISVPQVRPNSNVRTEGGGSIPEDTAEGNLHNALNPGN